jgi:hypothetical protein
VDLDQQRSETKIMSKTAVLISGQMRTFSHCLPSLYWNVFRKLKDPHFFVSCADDEQASSAYMLELHYPGKVHIEIVKQPTLPEPHKSYADHAPYAISVPIQNILRQLWHYNRVWEFFNEVTGELKDFTAFVRCRPDLFFHRFDAPAEPLPHEFLGVWKARCGGVNDRFAIMGPKAAEAYFTAFPRLQSLLDLGCPLHPESIQQAAMEFEGVGIRNRLTCEFTTVRFNGKNDPLLEYPGEMAQFLESTNSHH